MLSYSPDGYPRLRCKYYFLHVWWEGNMQLQIHVHKSICIVRSSYFLTDVTVHILTIQLFLLYLALCTQGTAVLPVLRIFHSGDMNKGYLRNEIQKTVIAFLLLAFYLPYYYAQSCHLERK